MKAQKHTQDKVHLGFLAGGEYDTEQLTFTRYKSQMFEEKLKALEQEVLNTKLDEDDIHHICDRVRDEFARPVATEKHLLENKRNTLDVRLDKISESLIYHHYQDLSDFERNKRLKKVNRKYHGLLKLQAKTKDLGDEVKSLEQARSSFKDAPMFKTLLNNSLVYCLLLSGFALGDGALSYNAMRILGEGIANISLAGLTALTAGGVAIGAHFTGEALAKEGLSKTFWSAVLISSLFVSIMVWLRLDVKSSVILSLLNIAFYAIASLISFKRYLSQDYWSFTSKLMRLKRKKAALEDRLNMRMQNLHADTQSVEIMLRHWADEQAAYINAHNSIKDANLKDAFEGMGKVLGGYYGRIEIIRKKALAKAEQRKERKKNGFKFPDFGFSTAIKSMFTLCLIFTLFGCSDAVKTSDTIFLFDLTESEGQRPAFETVMSHIEDMQSGSVIFSVISDRHAYPYKHIHLSAPKPYWQQIKEEEDQRVLQFHEGLKGAYISLPRPIDSPQQSLVFSALATHLKRLSQSTADSKKMIIYSDMLQYEKKGINFYRYQNNPKGLVRAKENIIQDFKDEYDPKGSLDLSEIEIIIYHTPRPEHDALWRSMQDFYIAFFDELHAKNVSYYPYIEGQNTGFIVDTSH